MLTGEAAEADRLMDRPRGLLRLAPATAWDQIVLAAARRPDPLILVPTVGQVAAVTRCLQAQGHQVWSRPEHWGRAASGGGVVVGTRGAVWAPRPRLGAVLVIDEHDPALAQTQAPTWNARDVALERAQRAGVGCLLTSPCPSLEALAAAPVITMARDVERAGWAGIEVIDRRAEPPGAGLWSPDLVRSLRQALDADGRPVACFLNRVGRARLVVCAACGELAVCASCGAAAELGEGRLSCRRCPGVRPAACSACASQRLKGLRPGVSRAVEELAALLGRPVTEVTAAGHNRTVAAADPAADHPNQPVTVGTGAIFGQMASASVVAFLDFDSELTAPRYRAAEQALALLARASRLVGGRGRGRVLVQTRQPGHEVIQAALHADPSRVAVTEGALRAALRLPPETAAAVVSGPSAPGYAQALTAEIENSGGEVEIIDIGSDRWLLRGPDHRRLCDLLAGVERPAGRLRVEVDPFEI